MSKAVQSGDGGGDAPEDDLERLLDAAEALFYERGFQAIGMDALRTASGLPLKRIYSLLPGKEAIAVAMLDRRDDRWCASLAERVDTRTGAEPRVLAVFDWLGDWLSGPGHRGCAWVNAFGELGGTSPAVVEAVRRHKGRVREYVRGLVDDAGTPEVADAVLLLVEGCMVTAGISGDAAQVAASARRAAERLLRV